MDGVRVYEQAASNSMRTKWDE